MKIYYKKFNDNFIRTLISTLEEQADLKRAISVKSRESFRSPSTILQLCEVTELSLMKQEILIQDRCFEIHYTTRFHRKKTACATSVYIFKSYFIPTLVFMLCS